MALTADILKKIKALEGLNNDQLMAIVNASQSDEDIQFDTTNKQPRLKAIMDARTKEIHDGYDKDIKEVWGHEKQSTEQTYKNFRRFLKEGKEAVVALKSKEDEIATLKTKVKEGGALDPAEKLKLEQAIKDKDDEIKLLKGKVDESKTTYEKQIADLTKKTTESDMLRELDKAEIGLTFSDVIPEDVRKEMIAAKRNAILSGVTQSTMKGAEGEVKVLRDANGEILRDMANGGKVHTLASYYTSQLSSLIDVKKTAQGGGGNNPKDKTGGGGSGPTILDLSGVKSQMEASDLVAKYLKEKGVSKTDPTSDYAGQQAAIYDENPGVFSLPLKATED